MEIKITDLRSPDLIEYKKKYYLKNKQKYLERSRAQRLKNPQKANDGVKAHFVKLRNEFLLEYGQKCRCPGCDITEKRFLTLEHVNQTGKAERVKYGGTYQILSRLRKLGWPKDGYTVLCMNCNWAERLGEPCPHKGSESP